MKLTSRAFQMNQEIPKSFSGEGQNISPPLEWSDVPRGTREFALTCQDPDSPKKAGQDYPFVHWLIYNISPSVTALPESLSTQEQMDSPVRADQGKNSFGKIGYAGPMPPEGQGAHRYHFRLYALNSELNVSPGATKDELVSAMRGHVLESVELVGVYKRKAATEAA